MWFFRFGDHTDFGLRVRKGDDNLWRWQIVSPRPFDHDRAAPDPTDDDDWVVRAVPPIRDAHETRDGAYNDAVEFVEGLGADAGDLTRIDRVERTV